MDCGLTESGDGVVATCIYVEKGCGGKGQLQAGFAKDTKRV